MIKRFKKAIKNILPDFAIRIIVAIIKRAKIIINPVKEWILIKKQPILHRKALDRVRVKVINEEKIKVAFFVIHSSVWKYEDLYKLLDMDQRFDPIIVVCPVINYGKENMIEEMDKTYNLFIKKKFNVIRTYDEQKDSFYNIKKKIKPDIIFFTNPHKLTRNEYYITNYKDVLSCYTQYSFHVTNLNNSQYNQLFHNILWKAFYETNIHEKLAYDYSRNKGANVIITGYPGIDDYIYGGRHGKDVWKNHNINLKRIIWAPHHTIYMREQLGYSCFLKYYQTILDIAGYYKDEIQIAFKPHPLLKVKLYGHKEWGKNRTDVYYEKWANLKNGQLETDDYVDLFNSSDAMILDSASFVAEYLCCGKPSLFTISDLSVKEKFNEFGKLALEQHYQAYDQNQIINFIESVVCKGNDTKKENRKRFYNNLLKPPNNKKACNNIYDEICKSIFK